MARVISVGAAQLGPIQKSDGRQAVVARMIALLDQAAAKGCDLVVYPELALTTFFPRWLMEDQAEIDAYFEREMPGPETVPLFERAKAHGIAFHLGYAELTEEEGRTRRFNTAILVGADGQILAKYRKIHLPGHAEFEEARGHQHLEKRYFEVGNLGFRVWNALGGNLGIAICNDRRWPETFRVLGLQDVELVMIGYNTPTVDSLSDEPSHLRMFHNHLTMQAGAYQNGTWVIGVAKAGMEDGHPLMAGSAIIAPTGEIVAQARTQGDELIVYDCDLDAGKHYKATTFNFAAHRRPEHYTMIVEETGAMTPDAAKGKYFKED
ncbi:MAG: N-carbamoyl-D-amino-acid hydrolase [Pseudomonadota bacterium]